MKSNLYVGFLMLLGSRRELLSSLGVWSLCFQPSICNGVKMGAKI